MCGVVGFLDSRVMRYEPLTVVRNMADRLEHRGPDDFGEWCDPVAGVFLGHRRLAIIDCSSGGHQPMVSRSGRYVVSYNGEIYNHQLLRYELECAGQHFCSRSDTEILLGAIEKWGITAAVTRLVGMFAFAVWDRESRVLTLARDRLGEKPFYYGVQGSALIFASELKALRAHPYWEGRLSREALTQYMRYGYVPAPNSIYQDVYKLPAGATVSIPASEIGGDVAPIEYWSAREEFAKGKASRLDLTDAEAVAWLDKLLRDAIAGQMISDVPLGAFLSGGIDSSIVVALMQAHSDRPVMTFSIGLLDAGFNESHEAKAVAQHLGTEHTEFQLGTDEAREVIPQLPLIYDEPFADSSQIPTYVVARLTRQSVKVALSGDGADEVFGGYNRHVWAPAAWERVRHIPPALRGLCQRMLHSVSPRSYDCAASALGKLLPRRFGARLVGNKVHKFADLLTASSQQEMYRNLTSLWQNPASLVRNRSEPANENLNRGIMDPDSFSEHMMLWDLVEYLPGDILTKVDRAAMAVSLETRAPFLDHRVIEFSARLPLSMKIREGKGKWLLRQLLYRYVPRKLVDRPKMGFGIPIGDWLRGPLRGWAEDLLDPDVVSQQGYLNPTPIQQAWASHLSGKKDNEYALWNVLMFQAWLKNQQRAEIANNSSASRNI